MFDQTSGHHGPLELIHKINPQRRIHIKPLMVSGYLRGRIFTSYSVGVHYSPLAQVRMTVACSCSHIIDNDTLNPLGSSLFPRLGAFRAGGLAHNIRLHFRHLGLPNALCRADAWH